MSKFERHAIAEAMRAISSCGVDEGMRRLLAFVKDTNPGDEGLRRLGQVAYVSDAERIRRQLAEALKSGKIGPEYTEFYFGLDDLNMPNGKGIEFGCGKREDKYTLYPGNIPSEALSKVFSEVGDNFSQYALGVGFLGLALKEAFAGIPANVALGGAPRRRVVFGFHDGDLFTLGTIKEKGFVLETGSSKDLEQKRIMPAAKGGFWWPENGAGKGEWLLASGRAALKIEDLGRRVGEVSLIVELLCRDAKSIGVDEMVKGLLEIEGEVFEPKDKLKIWLSAARACGAQGRREGAAGYLKLAKETCEGIEDDFWRENGLDDVHRCAESFGLAQRLGMLPTKEHQSITEQEIRDAVGPEVEESNREEIVIWVAQQIADVESNETMLNTGNYHHLMGQLERAAEKQLAAKDREGYVQTLGKIREIVGRWEMDSRPWIASSVCRRLGKLEWKGGFRDRAENALKLAAEAAQQERTASLRATAWSELAEAYTEIGESEKAVGCAKKIGNQDRKRESLAKIWVRTGYWKQLGELLAKIEDPEEAATLAMRISWVVGGEEE